MPKLPLWAKLAVLLAVSALTLSQQALSRQAVSDQTPQTTSAPAEQERKTPKTAEDFEELLAELTAEAAGYAKSTGDGPPPTSKAIEAVEYAPEAAKHLAEALRKPHELELARLYIAYQLIQPLENAGTEQLQKLQPAMLEVYRICRYKPMPDWPDSRLRQLAPPDTDASKQQRKRHEQARKEFLTAKRTKERAVVKFNRLADMLQKRLKVLLVRMADEQADELVLAHLAKEETSQWDTFHNTLEAIGSEAVHMPQDQAKRYYDALRQHMGKSPRKRQYLDPTRPIYSDKADSSFRARQMWFAQEAAKVVNLLATSAREPAIIVPGQKKPPRRPPRRHRRRR